MCVENTLEILPLLHHLKNVINVVSCVSKTNKRHKRLLCIPKAFFIVAIACFKVVHYQ